MGNRDNAGNPWSERGLESGLERLKALVVGGQIQDAVDHTEAAVAAGVSARTIVDEALIRAMDEVGERFECMEFYFPEMMAAAMAMQSCMALVRPLLVGREAVYVATVVLGTVKGDLHDIGKDLVGMMLEGAGFKVVNLGVDVSARQFVEAVRSHGAALVGMSALLTTTMPAMRTTMQALEEAGLREQVKVMVGGAAITEAYAREIGSDGYAGDATAATRLARSLVPPVLRS